MSRLDLSVDFVNHPAACGIHHEPARTPERIEMIIGHIKSAFTNEHSSRSTNISSTAYSAAKKASMLGEFLQPDSKSRLTEVAQDILTQIPPYGSGKNVLASFGGICVEIAEQILYHHPSQIKLAQLLSYISRSPKNTHFNEEYYAPFELLKDIFSDSLRQPDEEFSKEFVNLSAFAANLAAAGVWGNSPGTSLEALRTAFESKKPEEAWEQECNIMVAALWIIYNGQTLFKFLLYDYEEYEKRQSWNMNGFWVKGELLAEAEKTGLGMQPQSVERWRFWKIAFEAVEEETEVRDECKMVAKRAARFMGGIEEGMWFGDQSGEE